MENNVEKRISVSQIRRELKTSGFFLNCELPMAYTAGIPILQIQNGSLCLTFPFLKYKTTGEVDQTQVFPIRYLISLELPTKKVVRFEDLEYNGAFGDVDFDCPAGLFRHEAIRQYDKEQYRALYEELMECYSRVADFLVYGLDYEPEEESRMRRLLQLLVEPFLLPAYELLDRDFYNKYLKGGKEDGL